MADMTTSRSKRRVEPARGAKIVTGTATAVAFVGIVSGLQTAAAAADAAQARRQLVSDLAVRDLWVAQAHATHVDNVRIAQEAAAKKAAAKREAARKKAATLRRYPASGSAVGYRASVTAAPGAAAPKTAPRPAPKAAAPKPAPPVSGTSGGSGG
jgi:hypothetical protein